jgi:hypothetical protein
MTRTSWTPGRITTAAGCDRGPGARTAGSWANKLAHGFNVTDVPADLKRLHGEIDEAKEAWEQGDEGFGSEIADTLIYACGLGEMVKLNVTQEVERAAEVADEVEGNTADVATELDRLHGDVFEAEVAWEMGVGGFGSKLAKLVTHVCAIGEAAGLDVSAEVESKLAVNAARRYKRQPDGQLVKVAQPDFKAD